jgi:serine/threonine protein kinase
VLYFLSRYLEDKRQWKSEILALKNGERDREHLSHRDDETLFSLITSLLEEDPKKRPSAKEALDIPWKNIQSEKLTESTVPDGKQKAKKFYIKIDGEVVLKRCVVNDDTFFGLKAGIESCTGINAECQDLHQETTINGKEEQIEIVSDLDVVCMFQSAEEAGKKVVIIVSESTLEMDVNYGSNPVALS